MGQHALRPKDVLDLDGRPRGCPALVWGDPWHHVPSARRPQGLDRRRTACKEARQRRLRGGVYTISAIHAFADGTAGDQLRELAALEHPNKADLAEVRRLVDQAGGIAFARTYLESLAVQAVDALSALSKGPHRDALETLVRIVECE